MAYNCNILLGKISKLSGFDGTVAVKIEKLFVENIPSMESVFLLIDGRPVPFFISECEYSGSDMLKLRFSGYESVEKAEEFIGCNVYLTSSPDNDNQDRDNNLLAGYKVFDQNDVPIGIVTEILPNSGQWLLKVDTVVRKEVLIPLHEDLIISIDREQRTLFLEIPEGLFDL